jgi:hypothetical protein
MAYVDEPRPRKNQHLLNMFPKVTDSELRRFRERCDDNPDRVADFANGIRRLAKKYEMIEDDCELCVIYLKEKHIEGINDNFGVVTSGINLVVAGFGKEAPLVHSFISGITKHSPKVSEWIAYIYEPELEIKGDDEGTGNTAVGRLIPIPRDEVTMREMKTVLTDCQVPKPITNGIIELFSDGFGLKTVMAGIGTLITFFKPTTPVSTAGMASQLHDYL